MTETPWMRMSDEWVQALDADTILRLVAHINSVYSHLDENEGDRTETRESLEWLTSRGARGREWGIVGVAAEDLGLCGDA